MRSCPWTAPLLSVLALLSACGPAAGTRAPASASAPSGPPPRPTLTARDPVGVGVLAAMDPGADPCVDFYRYSCGGWLASTPRPPDKPVYGRGVQLLGDRNTLVLRDILEEAARSEHPSPDEAKLGALWRACNDEAGHARAGVAPLAPYFAAIARVRDAPGMLRTVGELHRTLTLGYDPLFRILVQADFADPDVYMAVLHQGGIGMPTREHYLEPEHAAVRATYERHVARMLQFIGEAPAAAPGQAARIVAFETELARISVPLIDLLDPVKTYNPIGVAGVQALDPKLWTGYFAGLGHADMGPHLSVITPGFFRALGPLLRATDVATLRAYLRWQLLNLMATELSPEIVAADFEFRSVLNGARELAPRWERCVEQINSNLPELLGRAYVARKFAGTSKELALTMIGHIERAFAAGLPGLAWLDPATRELAEEKLRTLTNKVGYPDRWLDHTALRVAPNDHMGNVVAVFRFYFDREFGRVGGRVDRGEWRMPPATVNAYYDRANAMVFPAGVLQPPYFSVDHPMAMNFGGIGLIMGHELTHGFDNRGRKFDARGVLREWWDPAAVARFDERTRCLERAYGAVEVLPGLKIDGARTLSENIADIGGLKAAHAGFKAWQRAHPDPAPQPIDGLDRDQLFFVGYAQVWCEHITDEALRMQVAADIHSPARARVNVTLAHIPAFADAWQCGPGTPMRAAEVCEVW